MRRSRVLTFVIAAGLVATACGSSPSSGGNAQQNTGKIGGKLVIDNESGGTWSCQFNPFNSGVSGTSIGFTYKFNREWQIRTELREDWQTASQPGFSYTGTTILFGVRTQR